MKRACFLAAALAGLVQATATAQMVVFPTAPGETVGSLLGAGQFFVALLSGLTLAMAFQLLLTNLSAAAGLSAVHVPEPGRRSADTGSSASLRETSDKIHGTIRKVGAGFGIWTIVTVSVSLFFASWLAVKLSGAGSAAGGALLGLTIWGVFYILATSLEATAAASAVGALAGVAKRGFQTASSAVSSLLSKSDESKAVDQAASITAAVRDELLGSSELRNRLSSFFDRFTDTFGPERHRKELQKLLDDVEIKSFVEGDEESGQLIMQLKAGGGVDSDKARSIASHLRNAIQRARQEKSPNKGQVDRAIDAGIRASGLGGEESEALRHRVENYLRQTGRPELEPEGIKQDLMAFFKDPSGGFQALRARAAQMDRGTATAVLQARGVSSEQAEMIVDRVVGAIRTVTGWSRDQAAAAEEQASSLQSRALAKVEAYLEELDRPALDPASVRHEIEMLFHDPKAGADALIQRARSLDRDDVKALLAHSSRMSNEHADKLVDQVMEARERALETADRIKLETERRLGEARDEALRQAEELRKTAATAAWWIFSSAVVSGLFAALGGFIAARPNL